MQLAHCNSQNDEALMTVDEEKVGMKVYSKMTHNVLNKYSNGIPPTLPTVPSALMNRLIKTSIKTWSEKQQSIQAEASEPSSPLSQTDDDSHPAEVTPS